MFVVGLGGSAQRLQTTSGVGVLLLGLAGHDHLFTHKRSMMRARKKEPGSSYKKKQDWVVLRMSVKLVGVAPWCVQTSWRPES